MPWPITPLVSLLCRSLRFWLPCIRKVAEQHDRYQQQKEKGKKSGGAVAGSLANASSPIRRLGDGGQQHYRRADCQRLGCNIIRNQRFRDPCSSAGRGGPGI